MKSLIMFHLFLTLIITQFVSAQKSTTIEYTGKTPEGLVGNGRSVVKVRPTGYEFHTGGIADGVFHLIVDGKTYELKSTDAQSTFFPGGVLYTFTVAELKVEILHGATEENAYVVAVRIKGKKKKTEFEIEQHGSPTLSPSGRVSVKMKNGVGEIIFFTGKTAPKGTFDSFRKEWEAQYQKGFQLQTPSSLVNRAVPFNRYLLDLGFDGRLHVCEIFRWRDVWSRDLGTGLVPGAMASGQFSRARTTLEYDLRRYATHNPRGLKVTEDPSQGGSAEGTAWLTHAIWKYYLLTGDKEFLTGAAKTLLPWVNAWIDRDYNNQGLLIDDTEWMDHSRFLLFPDGARILYSNVLFADLLNTFSKIEEILGDTKTAGQLQTVRDRFNLGINNILWNENTGEYDNLSLWGKRDERSSSEGNVLAILCNVAPKERVKKILQSIKKNNWRTAGSTTIFPPMTHVNLTVDHNYKMWPWWNAVEARARLRNGDIEGGIHLLECCSKTLEDEHYPGLMEELTSIDGVTEGGFAFLTAAGSYQVAIIEGLLGVDIIESGCARIRVSPNVPKEWKDWNATIPLPEGEIILTQKNGKLHIRITDPRIKIVEAKRDVTVEGAMRTDISSQTFLNIAALPEIIPVEFPELKNRNAAVLFDSSFSKILPEELHQRRISINELLHLDTTNISALIIPGNALPMKTPTGEEIKPALTKFLDRGNTIVFYGATMHDRGRMGEKAGVVDWYEYRSTTLYRPMNEWKFKTNRDGIDITHEKETGFVNGWFKPEYADEDWESIKVPDLWENHLKEAYDGWGWYRIHFQLTKEEKGETILLDLGEIDDRDWTYVNGAFVSSEDGWQKFRRYQLKPGDSAYAALKFGGDNVIAVQVFDGGGGGGLYIDSTKIGIGTNLYSWVHVEARTGKTLAAPQRSGVVSWGPGGDFFNSWETSRGAFGFKINGSGIDFAGPLSGISSLNENVQEAFTDFAISKPLLFQPLAFTTTKRNLLIPDNGERYPCMARIVNTETGGEVILIPASVTKTSAVLEVLKKLKIE
ncbi:MAG: hypothetical protein Q8N83_07575 [Ignavibacteria bacterium]|nr:hypothetical protein [Ignavibacteria bacterium]